MRISPLVLLLFALLGCGSDSTDAGKATTALNKGDNFSNRKDWDTAISCYTEAIRLKPDYAEAYFGRGFAHDEKGESDQAIKDFTETIRLKPDYLDAYFARGIAHRIKGMHRVLKDGVVVFDDDHAHEYDQAIKDFTQAIRLKPDDGYAYHFRGYAYQERGLKANAAADFAKAKELGYEP